MSHEINAPRCADETTRKTAGVAGEDWFARARSESYSLNVDELTAAGQTWTASPRPLGYPYLTQVGTGAVAIAGNGAQIEARAGIVDVKAGGFAQADDLSIVIVEKGGVARTDGFGFIRAKDGAKVDVNCPGRAVAEKGSQVVARGGALVEAQSGANVLYEIYDKGHREPGRFEARAGTVTHIDEDFGPGLSGRGAPRFVHARRGSTVYTSDDRVIAEDGSHVIAQPGATVLALPGSNVEAQAGSRILRIDGAQVKADNNATILDTKGFLGADLNNKIVNFSDGQLRYHVVGAVDHLVVPAGSSLYTTATSVIAQAGSKVEVRGNSQLDKQPHSVIAEPGSYVEAQGDDVQVIAKAGSTVKLTNGAKAFAERGAKVETDEFYSTVVAEPGAKLTQGRRSYAHEVPAPSGRKQDVRQPTSQPAADAELSKMHIKAGAKADVQAGEKAFAEKDSEVVALPGSMVIAESGSRVTAKAGSYVVAQRDSHVHAESGAKVFRQEGAAVEYDSAYQRVMQKLGL